MAVKEFLDTKDTAALENAAIYLRDQVLIRILRRLGCRVSEALGIELRNVDFANKSIIIEHEKVRIQRQCPFCTDQGVKPQDCRLSKKSKYCPRCGKNVDAIVKKSNQEKELRILPVDQATLDLIKAYIDKKGPVEKDGKTYLFSITRQYAWRIVKECAERAGLPDIINVKKQKIHHVSPHKLRDSFATVAANKDSSMESLKKLQEHLGHQQLDTTMRYVRTTGDQHRKWLEGIINDEESENADSHS